MIEPYVIAGIVLVVGLVTGFLGRLRLERQLAFHAVAVIAVEQDRIITLLKSRKTITSPGWKISQYQLGANDALTLAICAIESGQE